MDSKIPHIRCRRQSFTHAYRYCFRKIAIRYLPGSKGKSSMRRKAKILYSLIHMEWFDCWETMLDDCEGEQINHFVIWLSGRYLLIEDLGMVNGKKSWGLSSILKAKAHMNRILYRLMFAENKHYSFHFFKNDCTWQALVIKNLVFIVFYRILSNFIVLYCIFSHFIVFYHILSYIIVEVFIFSLSLRIW